MRILFVENHLPFARGVMRQFLAEHEVTLVPTLAEARQALADPFHVVLVDYDLDDGQGDELVRELRRAGNPLRVIAVSSHDAGNEALIAAGADAVCGKLDFARIGSLLERKTTGQE
jgi:DNA-binding response OmpR family regulator